MSKVSGSVDRTNEDNDMAEKPIDVTSLFWGYDPKHIPKSVHKDGDVFPSSLHAYCRDDRVGAGWLYGRIQFAKVARMHPDTVSDHIKGGLIDFLVTMRLPDGREVWVTHPNSAMAYGDDVHREAYLRNCAKIRVMPNSLSGPTPIAGV